MTPWPTQSFSGNGWLNSLFTLVWQGNPYPSQWLASTSQNPNWSSNWYQPLGISSTPMGKVPQPHPTLSTPYPLQKNPQPLVHPQLPTQKNLNPNNKIVHLVQIIEISGYEIEKKECNELRLRSGCIITPKENKYQPSIELETPLVHTPSTVTDIEIKQGEDTNKHKDLEKLRVTSPPFPERLTIPKPVVYPDFDLVGELKNICIKVPLLQTIQDIPIYAKTIKDICVKKPVRKEKTSPTIHIVGTLSDFLLGGETLIKYEDHGNPIVTVQIYDCSFPNTLVDLGATINILIPKTCKTLGIIALESTTILL